LWTFTHLCIPSIVGEHDLLHERVAHYIRVRKQLKRDAVDVAKQFVRFAKAATRPGRQIRLSDVTGDNSLGAEP
jgi:hypothetical protein